MNYEEKKKDLFSVSNEYYLAHCISADFALGKGIAVEFNKRFDMRNRLLNKYPGYRLPMSGGDCILEGRVLNLITKERYFLKPTIQSMTFALLKMRDICEKNNIKKVAMPTIGAGLDRLDWISVSKKIQSVFYDTDIEILICRL